MTDNRPVHMLSLNPHQKGYTACGRLTRPHVKVTIMIHHATCSECKRIVAAAADPSLHKADPVLK